MKPKLKRKKYASGGVNDPYGTQAFVTDELGNQIPTNTEVGAALSSQQKNTLSGVTSTGVGSAVPSASSNLSSGSTMGSIFGLAGGTALSAMSGKQDSNKAIQSAYKTPLYRAADVAMPGLGVGLQLADVGMNAASEGIANQFSDNTKAGRAIKKGQDWSEWGVDPGSKMALAQLGGLYSLATDKKQRRNIEKEEKKQFDAQKDALAMAQMTDQTIGTQQTNPVYGMMKNGGSLYSMAHGGLNNHESGIVRSNKNGVDKTKASMPEGAFVIPANKRDQAIQDGILEDKPISPNQGGVPIMISGGDVSNPEREGVIMPGKVKQLLAMGVDLDKYAPNADHSIYDLAGTRKNVMHGGKLGYATGNYVLPNKGYQAINDFEAGIGTFRSDKTKPNYGVPISMGTDNTYAQTADKDIIDDYIDKYVGQSQWNKMPDELKTQFRSFLFNHGVDDLAGAKGLAEAVLNTTGNDPRGNTTSFKNRQGISEQDAIDIIKNADFANKDIYNNYVNVLGNQYGPENIGKGMPEKYKDTLGGRAVDIHRLYTGDITAQDLIDRREGAITSQQQALNRYNGVQPPVNPPINGNSVELTGIPLESARNSLWNINNIVPQIPTYKGPDVTVPYRLPEPSTPPINQSTAKAPMTDEQKALAFQLGSLGLRTGNDIFSLAHNLRARRTPIAQPPMITSQLYNPDVEAIKAKYQFDRDKSLATAMYNARQAGTTPSLLTAIHANDLESGLSLNEQINALKEGARQQNIATMNKDMQTNLENKYKWRLAEDQAYDAFRTAKGEAVSKNLTSLAGKTQEGADLATDYLGVQSLSNDWLKSNQLAGAHGTRLNTKSEYLANRQAIDNAQKTLSSYQQKYPDKFSKIAPEIKYMNPIDAASYVEKNIS